MIGISSVMPTAVRIESTENTMSSAMIWAMAAAKPSAALPLSGSSSSPLSPSGSMLWWISLVAFHNRNRPPAIRIRSRPENAVSKLGTPLKPGSPVMPRSITEACRVTSQPISISRQMRMIRARARPIRRAFCCCSGGSLFDRIAMNTRLSIPSTISSAMRVMSAAQAAGSASKVSNSMRAPCQQASRVASIARRKGGPGG